MIEPRAVLVVYGLDPDGNPRAGRFAEPDAHIAVIAAGYLGYQVARIADAEALEALPAGNVFAQGIGFIPRKPGCDERRIGFDHPYLCAQRPIAPLRPGRAGHDDLRDRSARRRRNRPYHRSGRRF